MKKLLALLIMLAFAAVLYAQDYVILYDTEVVVTVQSDQDEITLGWTQELTPGLVGWRLYQSEVSGDYTGDPFAVIPFTGEQAEYTTTETISAEYGDSVQYYFVLTAVNEDGRESGYSNEVVYSAEFEYPVPFVPGSLRLVR